MSRGAVTVGISGADTNEYIGRIVSASVSQPDVAANIRYEAVTVNAPPGRLIRITSAVPYAGRPVTSDSMVELNPAQVNDLCKILVVSGVPYLHILTETFAEGECDTSGGST